MVLILAASSADRLADAIWEGLKAKLELKPVDCWDTGGACASTVDVDRDKTTEKSVRGKCIVVYLSQADADLVTHPCCAFVPAKGSHIFIFENEYLG